jgi:hypothetical protein
MAVKKKAAGPLPGPVLTPYQAKQIMATVEATRQRLLDIDPDIEQDAKLYLDMLDGESDAVDIMREFGRAYVDNNTLAEATATRIADLQARKARFDRRADAWKGALHALCQVAGIPGLPDTDFTAYTQSGRQKLKDGIEDRLDELPEIYVRTTREPNKSLILAHLKEGIEVPGAELDNGPDIFIIKRK